MTFPRQHHADKTRTRDDYRAQLVQFLVFARSLDDVTIDTLAARYPKLPRAVLSRELATAQARRGARA